MATIKNIRAEEIKDSRGKPTLKVIVESENQKSDFSVPSGASTGMSEAIELRDEDQGMDKAIQKIENDIKEALVGVEITNQAEIDQKLIHLDGTTNKSNLGGNSTIGVSIACAKLAALESNLKTYQYLRSLSDIRPSRSVPYLFLNLINGGKHAKGGTSFQEHLIIPRTENPEEGFEMAKKVQLQLEKIIKKEKNLEQLMKGDEGGFIIETNDPEEAFSFINRAIKEAKIDLPIDIGTDVASSSFYKEGKYILGDKEIMADELLEIYDGLIERQKLFSIEDPFDEEDFQSFNKILEKYPTKLIVGDDLTTTNPSRLKKAIEEKSINSIIIKPNQIGTLSETLETMRIARQSDVHCIVSHRSGETVDDFVADLAYAFGVYGLKAGAPNQPERDVKYKRLIEIYSK